MTKINYIALYPLKRNALKHFGAINDQTATGVEPVYLARLADALSTRPRIPQDLMQ